MNTYNSYYCREFFVELKKQGLKKVFIAPGSRSTPLVLAAHELQLETIVHYDERGLSFMALGEAISSKCPVAIITTSGTAVANLLPAIVEAKMSHVPLIVLTADRPHELLDCGANQAIEQTQIFSSFVSFKSVMPAPNSKSNLAHWRTTAAHAYHSARQDGPVHINFHFQEPLVPVTDEITPNSEDLNDGPHISKLSSDHTPTNETIAFLNSLPKDSLVTIGPGYYSTRHHLQLWLSQNNLKYAADPMSGLRFTQHNRSHWITDPSEINSKISTIVHFGGSFISKSWNQFISGVSNKIQILPRLERQNPYHQKSNVLVASLGDWMKKWKVQFEVSHTPRKMSVLNQWCEPAIFQRLNHLIPDGCLVYSGSSRPIRDFDLFCLNNNWEFQANRGASGIDGNIATFAGHVHSQRYQSAVAVIGDLTALHDINSLSLLNQTKIPTVLIVINNNGGGIFSFLPVSQVDSFEKYWGTPHQLKIQPIASAFKTVTTQVTNLNDFESEFLKALNQNHLTVIEALTDRSQNREFHQMVFSK